MRVWAAVAVALFVSVGTARSVQAAPIANVTYLETSLGGGQFRYDYTVENASDPATDLGADAFDFALFFTGNVLPALSTLPSGWDMIGGAGFLDAFSQTPGAAPTGSDIGIGQSQLFSFVFDTQIGDTAFWVVFTNPDDPSTPNTAIGTTAPASPGPGPDPVPEPSTLLLLGSGLAGAWRMRRASKARS
jgi:hypothetical protein